MFNSCELQKYFLHLKKCINVMDNFTNLTGVGSDDPGTADLVIVLSSSRIVWVTERPGWTFQNSSTL